MSLFYLSIYKFLTKFDETYTEREHLIDGRVVKIDGERSLTPLSCIPRFISSRLVLGLLAREFFISLRWEFSLNLDRAVSKIYLNVYF